MDAEITELLVSGAEQIGVPLSGAQADQFAVYMDELKSWSKKFNLTSLKEDRDIAIKHFLDSLTPLPYISMGSFLMDMGSGGGLPGIPMKIARPDLRLLMLDSTGKKVTFLNHIITTMKLKNAKALQQRAESAGFQDVMAGHLDVVVARAFGPTETIVEAGAPYLKKGGKLIAMKGPKYADERERDRFPGVKRTEVVELTLPFSGDSRIIVIFEKV